MNEREEDFWTLDAMRSHGGRFVHRLSELYYFADEHNKDIIRKSWPEYWKTYAKLGRETHGKLMKMRKWCIENTCLDYHAKASQRAEAFLRTIGKWEEEE